LPSGKVFLEARYRPPHDWRDAAVSPTVPVEVLPAPPVAVWPYVVSPALTLLAAAIVFAARDRRWRAWRRRRAERRRAAAPPPLRARIFDTWRRAALPLYPSPKVAETMTPRELAAFVARRRLLPHDRLTTLTALVESAVWGAHAPSSEDLEEAERLAASLKP